MKAVNDFIKANRWDYWVCLGDLCDMSFISKYDMAYLRKIQGKSFVKQYAAVNAWMDEQEANVRDNNPDCKMALLEGNHDYRVEAYLDANPQMEGMVEVDNCLELAERDVKWVKSWSEGEILKIGKARFIHGQWTIEHHAAKHAKKYGANIFYGHTHDVQGYSHEKLGDNDTIIAQSLGCLQNYSPAYTRGAPQKWQQAFGVFYFMPGGRFTYYVPRIIKHSFVGPDGKVYRG
jgi:predicted phosphodiesterase